MRFFNYFALFTFVVFFVCGISAQEPAPSDNQSAAEQAETNSAENQPAVQESAAQQPAAQQPAETAPETAPAENQPAAQEPAAQQPAEAAPETAPAENQPAAQESAAQQPAEAAPETAPAQQPVAAQEPEPAEQPVAEQKTEEKQPEKEQETAETKPEEKQAEESASEQKQEEKQAAASQSDKEKDKEKEEKDRKIRDIEKKFWKGEVANIGANEIISPYNSIGLAAGVKLMDDELYLVINPKFSMHFDKLITEPVSEKELDLIFGIHAPMNIRVFSTDVNNKDRRSIRFRKEDWDEWQDYLKILRYFQIGTSEDNLYFSVGSNFAQTIGHGTILKRYIPNHDSTFSTMSAKLNWYFDYAGFEALLGDVARANIFGGLVFLKPFSAIGNYHARSVSFGYSFVADRNAPTQLRYEKYYEYSADEYEHNYKNVPRIAVDSQGRPVVEKDEFLYMQGIDFEMKLFKNEKADLKIFTDYSWFKKDFVKGGFTFGFLGRFNLDKKNMHAIRLQLEGRYHHDSYIPSFFDTFYDIERIEMMTNIYGANDFQPDGYSKYWHLQHDSKDKFAGSFYGEFSYSFRTWISLSVGYEKLPKSSSIFAHLELPDLWIVKMMVTYYKRGFGSTKELFSENRVSSLFRGVLRLQILPILYINGYAGKHWTFWNAKNPRPNDNLEGHYVSSWDIGGDVEFGWEWGRTGKENKNKKDRK